MKNRKFVPLGYPDVAPEDKKLRAPPSHLSSLLLHSSLPFGLDQAQLFCAFELNNLGTSPGRNQMINCIFATDPLGLPMITLLCVSGL